MPSWSQIIGAEQNGLVVEPPKPAKTTVERPKPAEDPRLRRPETRMALREWVREWLEVTLPLESVTPGNSTPLDYLDYVFFERGTADPVVWACRGGGKTLVGAIATLLDMIFKPGIEIRILGGSSVQAERMYEHLVRFVDPRFFDLMPAFGRNSRITRSGFRFANGSRVELLGQSESSVRGARVQKVRCDEVDLFSPKVWEAVQLTTRSIPASNIRGTIEAFSTMNDSHGVMMDLVKDKTRKLFRWGVWDVIESCSEECRTCVLEKDCRGIAKQAQGFVSVSDVRIMRGRVSDAAWAYEVLCDPAAEKKNLHRVDCRHY